MGEKTTLRMARQELEDLYLGVADDSVDLTFRDLLPRPPVAAPPLTLGTILDDDDDERTNKALLRSSTNIFTYKIESDDGGDQRAVVVPVAAAAGFELSPSPPPAAAAGPGGRRRSSDNSKQQHLPPPPAAVGVMMMSGRNGNNHRRPGIPHSNICALCAGYTYLFRHRCLVCGRVYCRRCVGAGMGDMTEGRKCIDCLGRRYSHRYIHKAGSGSTAGSVCCCLSFGAGGSSAVKAQELLWAEKGPAPRRRPRPASSSTSTSISTAASYGGGGAYSASMSMTMMSSSNNMATMTINGAPPPASFVANSFSGTNPHAFPL